MKSVLRILLGVLVGLVVVGVFFVLFVVWNLVSDWIMVPLSLTLAGLALVDLGGALQRRSRALSAARREKTRQPSRTALKAGRQTIHGCVAYDEGRDVAMRTEIEQEGTEAETKEGWTHTWTEVRRKVDTQPFFVVTDHGERVRVEPDESSLLWDELEVPSAPVPSTDPTPRRTRLATLSRDERVWVTGQLRRADRADVALSGDYRTPAVGEGWVMRAPPALFVTSVQTVTLHRERAALHGRHALLYALCFLASLPVPLGWIDRALGTTEPGIIVDATMHRGSKSSTSWTVVVQTPSGPYTQGVHHAPAINGEQPVRRGRFSSNLGAGPASTSNECFLGIAISGALLLTRWSLRRSSLAALPWFRRPGTKLVESGPGKLAESGPNTPA